MKHYLCHVLQKSILIPSDKNLRDDVSQDEYRNGVAHFSGTELSLKKKQNKFKVHFKELT